MSKSRIKRDPFLEREQGKYEHPVPSREFIIAHLEALAQPATLEQVLNDFHISTPEEIEGLTRRLRAMERDGQLISNRRGSYALVSTMELVPGRVEGHKDGFGFLIPDRGGDDVFLPARQMRQVFTNDRVLVRVNLDGSRRRPEGVIVQVLERNTQEVVGRFYREGGLAFVDPDNKRISQDIIIPAGAEGDAQAGDFVSVAIQAQPSDRRQPLGQVKQVLGNQLTPGMEVELAIRSHQLPFEWPEAVLEQAQQFATHVEEKDCKDRVDLRHLPLVTIDGEDARDFDDAVYCEPRKRSAGWRLIVAIADVSYYVKEGTPLDIEAQGRGNSVYFPSRVIPMLPEVLSNGLCSLNPAVDRLAMVADIRLNSDGEVEKYQFYEAVIRSHARLTYTHVADVLERNIEGDAKLEPHLRQLYQLYQRLLAQRKARGAIEFETTETKIIFDELGKIHRIKETERNEAHRLIEEMMLCANVCTAHFLLKSKITGLYRVHQGPDEVKLLSLRTFLKAFGLRLGGGDKPTAQDYAKLLERVLKRPDAHLIQTVMLRSLRQAIYSPDNVGHFGLAYAAYTHFTSPIRRYPDLLVHRAIKHILSKRKANKFAYDKSAMQRFGEHCSMTERRADLATRDATDWLKCDFMRDKIGHEFIGRIAEVTGFGLFVELEDIYIQGLVHISSLVNDYYHFDPTHFSLTGKRSGVTYLIGDSLRVRVTRVDMDKRSIDFELAQGAGLPRSQSKKAKTGKSSGGAKPKESAKANKARRGARKKTTRR